jgi:hypothetical protein
MRCESQTRRQLTSTKHSLLTKPRCIDELLRCPLERGGGVSRTAYLFQIVDPSTICSTLACQVNVGFEPQWSKTLGPCLRADQICVRVPLFPNPAYVVALRLQVQLGSHLPLLKQLPSTHTKTNSKSTLQRATFTLSGTSRRLW